MVNHHNFDYVFVKWLALVFSLALPFSTIPGGIIFRDFCPLFRHQCHELGDLVVAEFDSSGANSAA